MTARKNAFLSEVDGFGSMMLVCVPTGATKQEERCAFGCAPFLVTVREAEVYVQRREYDEETRAAYEEAGITPVIWQSPTGPVVVEPKGVRWV